VSILELLQVERFIPKSSDTQRMGRKLRERESIARSFFVKAVYVYPVITGSFSFTKVEELLDVQIQTDLKSYS
jgi:hypothetical protein